jgi:hypothetical protein
VAAFVVAVVQLGLPRTVLGLFVIQGSLESFYV